MAAAGGLADAPETDRLTPVDDGDPAARSTSPGRPQARPLTGSASDTTTVPSATPAAVIIAVDGSVVQADAAHGVLLDQRPVQI